jgi:uncharacterized protein with HEPN domain
MRNRLVHAYLDIDLDIVWNTVQVDLPAIGALALRELGRLRAQGDDDPS